MFDQREPCAITFGEDAIPDLKKRLAKLRQTVSAELKKQGFTENNIVLESYLNLRQAFTRLPFQRSPKRADTTGQTTHS
jgi:hypothetical protein